MSEKEEDYLKVIYKVVSRRGFARSVEISDALGVSAASVTDMLKKLQSKGLVIYEKYRGILLTPGGEKMARELVDKERIIQEFFSIFGVSQENAEIIANKVEHYIDPESFSRIKKFVEFVRSFRGNPRWLEHFNEFIHTGKLPPCERIESEEE